MTSILLKEMTYTCENILYVSQKNVTETKECFDLRNKLEPDSLSIWKCIQTVYRDESDIFEVLYATLPK